MCGNAAWIGTGRTRRNGQAEHDHLRSPNLAGDIRADSRDGRSCVAANGGGVRSEDRLLFGGVAAGVLIPALSATTTSAATFGALKLLEFFLGGFDDRGIRRARACDSTVGHP